MSSAMDALKYSNYMTAAAGHGMGIYPFTGQDGSGGTTAAGQLSPSQSSGQDPSKPAYSDALSRSYLEQQKSYYESAGIKGYGGGGDRSSVGQSVFDTKSYTPDSMTERQSTESPDIKKNVGGLGGGLGGVGGDAAQQLQQQQQAALQAYYSGTGGSPATSQATGLPPLLPMAAQLSQYTSGAAGYSQTSPGTDYSRRPLSVLF